MQFLNFKFIFLVFCTLLLNNNSYAQSKNHSQSQEPIPASTLNLDSFFAKRIADLKGQQYLYSDILAENSGMSKEKLKRKVIFIHTWFAACQPCIAEFAELNELYKLFRSNKDFAFISFTFEDKKTIEEIKIKYNIKYNIYSIDKNLCRKINLSGGYPANILLYHNFSINNLYITPVRTISEFIKTEVTPKNVPTAVVYWE